MPTAKSSAHSLTSPNGNEPADLITMTNELRKRDQLDAIGGASYLASLIDSVPTAANIEYYARIVREKAVLRK